MYKTIKLNRVLLPIFGAFALVFITIITTPRAEAAAPITTTSAAPTQLAWWYGPYWQHRWWRCPKTCWQGRWGYWHCERRC